VGEWLFNGNANDSSGNGNNGVVSSAVLTNDRFGIANQAYWFDGVLGSYIMLNSTSNFNQPYSVSLGLNPTHLLVFAISFQ
jgi:hypothetical protein